MPLREGEKELHTLMISQWNAGKYVIMTQGGDMLVVASESLALLNQFNMVRGIVTPCTWLHLYMYIVWLAMDCLLIVL